jgi:hypothetical protein
LLRICEVKNSIDRIFIKIPKLTGVNGYDSCKSEKSALIFI